MPAHEVTDEADWLSANYGSLHDYRGVDLRGQWVAVLGRDIVGHDPDPEALVARVTRAHPSRHALFAAVVAERLG